MEKVATQNISKALAKILLMQLNEEKCSDYLDFIGVAQNFQWFDRLRAVFEQHFFAARIED